MRVLFSVMQDTCWFGRVEWWHHSQRPLRHKCFVWCYADCTLSVGRMVPRVGTLPTPHFLGVLSTLTLVCAVSTWKAILPASIVCPIISLQFSYKPHRRFRSQHGGRTPFWSQWLPQMSAAQNATRSTWTLGKRKIVLRMNHTSCTSPMRTIDTDMLSNDWLCRIWSNTWPAIYRLYIFVLTILTLGWGLFTHVNGCRPSWAYISFTVMWIICCHTSGLLGASMVRLGLGRGWSANQHGQEGHNCIPPFVRHPLKLVIHISTSVLNMTSGGRVQYH